MFPAARALAGRARPGKDGLVTDDPEAGLLGRNLAREEHFRHVDIDEDAARCAADVVVAVSALVEAAGLVTEWEFEDQAALSKQVQRAIDGSVGNRWITSMDALKDLTRC